MNPTLTQRAQTERLKITTSSGDAGRLANETHHFNCTHPRRRLPRCRLPRQCS
jgi:hypothetical protein